MRTLRIAMAQINPVVGDLAGNSKMIADYTRKAVAKGSELVIFPELALTGYPPEDLLLKPHFIEDNLSELKKLVKKIKGITAVIGFVDSDGEYIYNAAAIIREGKLAGVYRKMFLPNYGVFDEERYFQAGTEPLNVKIGDITIGIGICEDIWHPEGPAKAQALCGAEVIVNINASPYHMGKALLREEMLATRAVDNEVIIAYNNMVGGQDELVFDGQSMIIDEKGEITVRGKAFTEELIVADLNLEGPRRARCYDKKRRKEKLDHPALMVSEVTIPAAARSAHEKKGKKPVAKRQTEKLAALDEVLSALTLGTKDYVRKNGFKHAVLALSGGIDSALVAAIATRALGPDKITCVYMPSRYSSPESRDDAAHLAKNLGLKLMTIPIDDLYTNYIEHLKKPFGRKAPNVAEENLQARIRGNIIMALSNKFGYLVFTTGNKSETAVGYSTLYGDMAGGFAIILDVPKTLVYELSRHINATGRKELIPERIINKPPSAELKPDQTDQDTLPPYEELDPILKAYVEEDCGINEITAMGFKKAVVQQVVEMVDRSEYKRRQAPPGIKITTRAFGKDRRMPITNGYVNKTS